MATTRITVERSCWGRITRSMRSFIRPQKNPLKEEPKNNFEFFTKDAYAYYLKMGTLANLDSPPGNESAVPRPDDP